MALTNSSGTLHGVVNFLSVVLVLSFSEPVNTSDSVSKLWCVQHLY